MEKKVMSDYTLFCTPEQTKKALALGAPIEYASDTDVCCGNYFSMTRNEEPYRALPTAEQMVGWLEEQGILIDIDTEWNKSVLVYVWDCENKSLINNVFHGSRKEATLAAIDVALDYLIEQKKK